MATVSSLVIYPVKGCRGVQVEEALVLPTGTESVAGLVKFFSDPESRTDQLRSCPDCLELAVSDAFMSC